VYLVDDWCGMGQVLSLFQDASIACFERVRPYATTSPSFDSNLVQQRVVKRRASVTMLDKPVTPESEKAYMMHANTGGLEKVFIKRVSSSGAMRGQLPSSGALPHVSSLPS